MCDYNLYAVLAYFIKEIRRSHPVGNQGVNRRERRNPRERCPPELGAVRDDDHLLRMIHDRLLDQRILKGVLRQPGVDIQAADAEERLVYPEVLVGALCDMPRHRQFLLTDNSAADDQTDIRRFA